MSDQVADLREQPRPRVRPRLLRWFAVGFGVSFVGMLLLVTHVAMHPSGAFLVSCRLWQYYLIERRSAFGPSARTLGLASGGLGRLSLIAFEHVVCSAFGGAIVAVTV